MASQHMHIDMPITFSFLLKKYDSEKANRLTNCVTDLSLSNYSLSKFNTNAQIIRDHAKSQKLQKLGNKVVQNVLDHKSNADVIIEIQKGLDQIGENNREFVRSKSSILKAISNQIFKVQSGEFEFINLTGINRLDGFLKIEPGYLLTIGGESNVGKSFLCSQIAEHVGNDKGVLLYSLEMLDSSYIRRILSSSCGTSASNIKAGKIDPSSQSFMDASERYLNSRIDICDDASISLIDMEMKALSIKRKKGLDVVIIDHLGLINYGSGRKSDTERIQELMPKLKAMAKKLEVVLVLVSQLKKDSYGQDVSLSSLKGSSSIVECSDVILGLYDHHDSGKVIKIIKNREGARDNTIRLNLNIDRSRFEPYDPVYQNTTSN
jgi:replicative DNA helicase